MMEEEKKEDTGMIGFFIDGLKLIFSIAGFLIFIIIAIAIVVAACFLILKFFMYLYFSLGVFGVVIFIIILSILIGDKK